MTQADPHHSGWTDVYKEAAGWAQVIDIHREQITTQNVSNQTGLTV